MTAPGEGTRHAPDCAVWMVYPGGPRPCSCGTSPAYICFTDRAGNYLHALCCPKSPMNVPCQNITGTADDPPTPAAP